MRSGAVGPRWRTPFATPAGARRRSPSHGAGSRAPSPSSTGVSDALGAAGGCLPVIGRRSRADAAR
eukprot:5796303-Lingulodinium_polyedra.AAC.1